MINQQLEDLYQRWSTTKASFIKGGVIDENEYINAPIRVLFLLKEVNSKESGWSLVDLVKRQIQQNSYLDIWETIGLWSFAMIQGYKPYKDLYKSANYLFQAGIADGLSQIATTNVKKECGNGLSDMEEIEEYAVNDIDFIKEEIEIINPQIVICGGTYYLMERLLGIHSHECGSGAKVGKYKEIIFVDMPHPRARVSKQVLYAYFKETMVEVEKMI